jgi:hypothetical protein
MATYYVNATSVITNGLTAATGYHNISDLIAHQVPSLAAGDIIEITDNATIDNSTSNIVIPSIGSITIRSYIGNTIKPTVKLKPSTMQFGSSLTSSYPTIVTIDSINFIVSSGVGAVRLASPSAPGTLVNACYFKGVVLELDNSTVSSITKSVTNCIFSGRLAGSYFSLQLVSNVDCIHNINNNTFYGGSFAIAIFADSSNCKFLNNIFDSQSNATIYLDSSKSLTGSLIDYNLTYNWGLTEYYGSNIPPYLGSHIQSGVNPLLVNPSGDDFTFTSLSPAKSNGIGHNVESSHPAQPTVPTKDFIGTTRPQQTYTDIGAYEYLPPPPSSNHRIPVVNFYSWQNPVMG